MKKLLGDCVLGTHPWWTIGGKYTAAQCMLAGRFRGAASAAVALNNLTGGTDFIPVGTPVWSATNGFYNFATGAYALDTSILPSPTNQYSYVLQWANAPQIGVVTIFGTHSTTPAADFMFIRPYSPTNTMVGRCAQPNISTTFLQSGNGAIVGNKLYRDATAVAGTFNNWIYNVILPIWLGGMNWDNVSMLDNTDYDLWGAAFYNVILTGNDVTFLRDVMSSWTP